MSVGDCDWDLASCKRSRERWIVEFRCRECGATMRVCDAQKFARDTRELHARANGVNCVKELAIAELLGLSRH